MLPSPPLCVFAPTGFRVEALEDGAGLITGVRIAVGNQAGKLPAQISKLPYAGVDQIELGGGKVARCSARVAALLQGEQTDDLRERKSHRLSALDEAQSLGIGLDVSADAAWRARRLRHQSQPLVVANRLDVNPGRCGKAGNRVDLRHGLTPYHGTEFMVAPVSTGTFEPTTAPGA